MTGVTHRIAVRRQNVESDSDNTMTDHALAVVAHDADGLEAVQRLRPRHAGANCGTRIGDIAAHRRNHAESDDCEIDL
jgi:hypothetical protein